jgi:hypothetical protein
MPEKRMFDGPKAEKVLFLKSFFEDDFPERGMIAWFIRYEWYPREGCYKLFFDFKDFEKENEKYFTETYYANDYTKKLIKSGVCGDKTFWTALESGNYSPKYSVYFSLPSDERNDEELNKELLNYLKPIV